MSRAIGIDLGTVFSCVASVIDGQAVVLPDEDGFKTQPSVFSFSGNREVLIGRKAVAQQITNPLNTIFAIKRLIGLRYDSKEVATAKQKAPYRIIPSANGDAWVEVDGNATSPEEVSAHILNHMRKIAERYFNEKVTRAVITVPAHFNDAQRQATRDAGRIAGMEVMRIINEPTAAALAYGMDRKRENKNREREADRTIAVFDLGGGTFDVSILEMRHGTFEVLSTHGDTYLGGEDIDLAIVDFLVDFAKKNLNADLQQDKMAMQRLKTASQNAKHQLSDVFEVIIDLPYIARGMKNLQVRITRDQLARIAQPVLRRLEVPCLAAMEDAEVLPKEITDVVLVGGQTRMPAVKQYCKTIFGSTPHDDINPDEAVAVGAAIQAALLDGLIEGVKFEDVLPLSLGIETQGGMVYPLIPRNTKLPARATRVFTTSAPYQSEVTIHVIQGESRFAPNNETLGLFELSEIPSAPRGYPEIAVSFSADENGIIHVSARDLDTGDAKNVEIVASSGLEDRDLDALTVASRMFEDQEDRLELREQGRYLGYADDTISDSTPNAKELHLLRSLVFESQAILDTQGHGYRGRKRRELEELLLAAREEISKPSSLEKILDLTKKLAAESQALTDFVAAPWN